MAVRRPWAPGQTVIVQHHGVKAIKNRPGVVLEVLASGLVVIAGTTTEPPAEEEALLVDGRELVELGFDKPTWFRPNAPVDPHHPDGGNIFVALPEHIQRRLPGSCPGRLFRRLKALCTPAILRAVERHLDASAPSDSVEGGDDER